MPDRWQTNLYLRSTCCTYIWDILMTVTHIVSYLSVYFVDKGFNSLVTMQSHQFVCINQPLSAIKIPKQSVLNYSKESELTLYPPKCELSQFSNLMASLSCTHLEVSKLIY